MYLKFLEKFGKEHIFKFLDEPQKKVFIDFYKFLDDNKDKIQNNTLETFSEFKQITI